MQDDDPNNKRVGTNLDQGGFGFQKPAPRNYAGLWPAYLLPTCMVASLRLLMPEELGVLAMRSSPDECFVCIK
jgi:hypothetical protein